jgi:hypothetical protein
MVCIQKNHILFHQIAKIFSDTYGLAGQPTPYCGVLLDYCPFFIGKFEAVQFTGCSHPRAAGPRARAAVFILSHFISVPSRS